MINVEKILGSEAKTLLGKLSPKIPKSSLVLPSQNFIQDVFVPSDRSPQILRSLRELYGHGRLGHTGYLSIFPLDQGVEHSGNASFTINPEYYNPENIIRLALESGCSGVATTFGVFGSVARTFVGRIPFIVKINHNELLSYPNSYKQIMFGRVRDAWNM